MQSIILAGCDPSGKSSRKISVVQHHFGIYFFLLSSKQVVERAVGMIQVLWEEIIINSSVDVEENAIRQKDAITR